MTWIMLTPSLAHYSYQSHDPEPGATYSMVRAPVLMGHVELWVKENITGDWEVRCKEYGRSKQTGETVWWETHRPGKADISYDWYETIAIQFESDEDAALFKLFWL